MKYQVGKYIIGVDADVRPNRDLTVLIIATHDGKCMNIIGEATGAVADAFHATLKRLNECERELRK